MGSGDRATRRLPWNGIAPVYDWQLALERQPLRAALELAAPVPEERLLDLGTGTGAVLRALGAAESRPREAIGVDPSARMLARVPPLPSGWTVQEGDATNLPFPAASFELVTAAFLLHVLEPRERTRVLREVRRVLSPGGRIVTVTPIAPRSLLRRPFRLAVGALERTLGTSLGLNPFDPSAEIADQGFTVLRARYVPLGYPSLCVLARSSAERCHGEATPPGG